GTQSKSSAADRLTSNREEQQRRPLPGRRRSRKSAANRRLLRNKQHAQADLNRLSRCSKARSQPTRGPAVMVEACRYSDRPLAFRAPYVGGEPAANGASATAGRVGKSDTNARRDMGRSSQAANMDALRRVGICAVVASPLLASDAHANEPTFFDRVITWFNPNKAA